MAAANSKPVILWAEDDDNDVILFSRAFQRARVPETVVRVHDGQEVIQYLTGEGCYADRAKYPLPSLLLLDLKMPGKNGFDVVEWKKAQPSLRNLPAVVFSSSSIEQDVETAHQLGARAYLVKPPKLEEMSGIVERLSALQSER